MRTSENSAYSGKLRGSVKFRTRRAPARATTADRIHPVNHRRKPNENGDVYQKRIRQREPAGRAAVGGNGVCDEEEGLGRAREDQVSVSVSFPLAGRNRKARRIGPLDGRLRWRRASSSLKFRQQVWKNSAGSVRSVFDFRAAHLPQQGTFATTALRNIVLRP